MELTHSTRLSSPTGCDVSTGFRPVISSKRTTPKEYTSELDVNFPLVAYSGARYLQEQCIFFFQKSKVLQSLKELFLEFLANR